MKTGKLFPLVLPLVLVMVLAVACGDDEPAPAPAPSGITAADLQAAMESIQIPAGLSEADVSRIVTDAAQPGISADEVSRIVSDQLDAQPGISAADLQKAVDDAVSKAAAEMPTADPGMTAADLRAAIASIQIPEGLSEDDVTKIVEGAVQPGLSAAEVSKIVSDQLDAQPGITAADLQKAVDDAVMAAGGITAADLQSAIAGIQIPEGLSQADVTKIVEGAMQPGLSAAEVSKIVSDQLDAHPGITAADLQEAVDSAVVKAVAAAATSDPSMTETMEPTGTLNVAFPELGSYQAHPAMTSFPQASIVELAALESLHGRDLDWDYYPRLMVSWSVAPDQLTWTFNLREDVQFHDGWGEFTAEDFIWTLETASAEGSINPQAAAHREKFLNPEGYLTALDDHTIEVNTGKPFWDLLTSVYSPGSDPVLVNSKTQATELEKSIGLDAANSQLVGTGPWKIAESQPGEYWHFHAVMDHYLKTPYFAEMRFHEIPEESTRVANFQTRRIDVFTAVPDTIPLLANTPGTEFMAQKGAIDQHLLFYGNYYHSADPETCPGRPGGPWADKPEFQYCPAEGWDPDAPYVSANPDLDSPEWEQARKVRLAMMVAIDRQKIIEELLHGEGEPLSMQAWGNQQGKPEWVWEYDLERAKQLLAEAGYPDGFEMDLYPAVRGAPSEVEACEAIGAMWEELGLDVNIIKIPFNTLVEAWLNFSQKGIACNAAPPFIEPVWLYYYIHLPNTGVSVGVDHPIISKMIDDAFNTFDKEERWEKNLEIGSWFWDNKLNFGLWTANQVHALGPKVGDWGEHLETGNTRRISGLEWAPHR